MVENDSLASATSVAFKKRITSQKEKVNNSLRDSDYRPAYEEWEVQAALYDALDHRDEGADNLLRIGEMPNYIVRKFGISGDLFIYRNHAYENLVSREQAKADGRERKKAYYHNLGIEKMTNAIMGIENPIMTIASRNDDGNPTVILILPENGNNGYPLYVYAVFSFYADI